MKQKYITEVLDTNSDTIRYTFNIPSTIYKNGDYLHKVYLKITLPAIYSSLEREFRWNKYIGYNIIDKVICNIKLKDKKKQDVQIRLFSYTEWLYIWYEINLSEEEKINHYQSIGHIPELYDPASSKKNNGLYPISHLKKQKYKWIIDNNNNQTAAPVVVSNDLNFNKPPSIPETVLYIPFNFYFCNNIKEALPLHILDDKIDFEIKLKDINKLYTVLLNVNDFNVDTAISTANVSTTNYFTNIKLNSNILFVNNDNYSFSSNVHYSEGNSSELSMFDVLINNYRIVPLLAGDTAINNFIINKSLTNLNQDLNVTTILSKNDFYQIYCKANIMFNIISTTKFNQDKIKFSGLLSDSTENQLLFDINPLSTDRLVGSINDTKLSLNIINNFNNKDIFFLLRHNERIKKNDFFNFTNLDFNNTIPWNASSSNSNFKYNSDIEVLQGSLWEHQNNSKSIKIGIDEVGTFFIKKQILDNNIFKYINILEYKSPDVSQINSNLLRWSYNSDSIFNESIISECAMKIIYRKKNVTENISDLFSQSKESYNFFNKITIQSNYKNTIPGLYYISNSYTNIKSIELSQATISKININNQNSYNYIVYCNSYKTIDL